MIEELTKDEVCPHCGAIKKLARLRVICDNCGKVICEGKQVHAELELTIFIDFPETRSCHFCSWKCVREFLLKLNEKFDFISLPYLRQEDLDKFRLEFIKGEKNENRLD
jgi:hypothetical protein